MKSVSVEAITSLLCWIEYNVVNQKNLMSTDYDVDGNHVPFSNPN